MNTMHNWQIHKPPIRRTTKRLSLRIVLAAFVCWCGVNPSVLMAEALASKRVELRSESYPSLSEHDREVIRSVRAIRQNGLERDSARVSPVRCATGLMLEASAIERTLSLSASQELSQLLTRPVMEESYNSPAGFFKLHYDLTGTHAAPGADLDSSGIPDFVERLALIADSSWKTIVIHLGYLAPPVDDFRGGDNRYDIYFQDINAFGFTQGETAGPAAWNDFSSYIVSHNSFEGFRGNDDPEGDAIGSAKATLAHEIYHAVQFAYDVADETWFMESSAGWIEEIVFDESNDNYNVLPDFFARPEVALTSNSFQSDRIFGTFIWPIFLAERFDTTLLRQIWEGARFKKASEALADTLPVRFGVTRNEAYSEFVSWLHLTGLRDDGNHFSEGASYPSMNVAATISEYPVINAFSPKSPAGYASAAIRFAPGVESGDLKLTLDGFNGRDWMGLLITTRNQNEHEIKWFALDADQRGSVIVNNFETYDEVTLVALNLSIYTSQVSFTYSAEIIGSQGIATSPMGDSIAYTLAKNPVGLHLTNLSMSEDSFVVSMTASGGWTFNAPLVGSITLQPGADTVIIGKIIPPAGTLPRALSIVRIRATSLTDPNVRDSVAILQVVSVRRGDPNWDGSLNIADVIYIISRLFLGGPAPVPEEIAGDPDCTGKVNIGDVTFIIARLFNGGPPPPCQPIDPLGG